jgi:hypothetical protein
MGSTYIMALVAKLTHEGGQHPLGESLCLCPLRYKIMEGSLIKELLRPWKLVTLFIGLSLLIAGSFYYNAPDWDIPICFIMAGFAYLTAPWSLRVILEKRWRHFPLMLFYTWFTVDGCYTIYWYFKNPMALELMRDVNFLASLSLYGMCALVWYYQGSVKDFIHEVKQFASASNGA